LEELFEYPIKLAETQTGQTFVTSAYDFQGLNIIVGLKYMGKSHLAKAILLGLIENEAGCLVLDINNEYSSLHLGKNRRPIRKYKNKIITLTPGDNLRFPLRAMGTDVFLNCMEALGLKDASLAALSDIIHNIREDELTINRLNTAISSEATSVRGAISRRLTMLMNTGLIDDEVDPRTLDTSLNRLDKGKALIVNLKGLTKIAMRTTVQVLLSKVTNLLEQEELKPVFLFAEEAHMYAERTELEDLVTRMRHLGAWQFYMTNTPTSLPELVIRQTDNLFCFYLSLPEDITHVAPASGMDSETLRRIVTALPVRQFLAVGRVTEDYPLVLKTMELDVVTAGETRLRFTEP
jgi:hypothetical protein